MKTLFKIIIWLTFIILGIMLTGMCERDWPTTAWIIFWIVVGVAWIEIENAVDITDSKMKL